jgi:hypothetical protein
MTAITHSDRWHELLSTRFVCESCLTRYFVLHRCCPACHRFGTVRPLVSMLLSLAYDDEDLRTMIAQGQTLAPQPKGEAESPPDFEI